MAFKLEEGGQIGVSQERGNLNCLPVMMNLWEVACTLMIMIEKGVALHAPGDLEIEEMVRNLAKRTKETDPLVET